MLCAVNGHPSLDRVLLLWRWLVDFSVGLATCLCAWLRLDVLSSQYVSWDKLMIYILFSSAHIGSVSHGVWTLTYLSIRAWEGQGNFSLFCKQNLRAGRSDRDHMEPVLACFGCAVSTTWQTISYCRFLRCTSPCAVMCVRSSYQPFD
jgi:hypothetical protein